MVQKILLEKIFYISIIIIFFLLFSPISIGGAYQANSLLEVNPSIFFNDAISSGLNFLSIIGYILIIYSIKICSNTDTLSVIKYSGFFTYISIIFSYYIFLKPIPSDSRIKTTIIFTFPLIILGLEPSLFRGYVLNFTIPLSLIILYIIFYKNNPQDFYQFIVILLLAWAALGFYWHTFDVMIFIVIIIWFLIHSLFSYKFHSFLSYRSLTPFLLIIIFVSIWFYIRTAVITYTLFNPNIDINLMNIFQKGSYTGVYSYNSFSNIQFIDVIRYIGYALCYIILVYILIKSLIHLCKGKDIPLFHQILISLLISDLLFQLLYYIAIRSVAPKILILFSIPLIILCLFDNKNGLFRNNKNFSKILAFFLIIPVLLTSFSGLFILFKEEPETNISTDLYDSSIQWTEKYTLPEHFIADSHTLGHFRARYSDNYYLSDITFSTITYLQYDQIIKNIWKNTNNEYFIVNSELYNKHLIFGSLESWNKFEPLNPNNLKNNENINSIYNDGRIIVMV